MRIGLIQSSFIPWRGYFDFIASVDLFVFHDDLQYTKGDWRNRNRIKTTQGCIWLTVPVSYQKTSQLICDTPINNSTNWRKSHLNQWRAQYTKAAFFGDIIELLGDMGDGVDLTISQMNIRLVRSICAYLDIHTPMMLSSELNIEGARTERLIKLLRAVGGTTYLSGPSADDYLEKDRFREAGICLEYKSYDYEPYPQLWGAFEGGVTVLDLIANCGPQSKDLIHSRTPDLVVIS